MQKVNRVRFFQPVPIAGGKLETVLVAEGQGEGAAATVAGLHITWNQGLITYMCAGQVRPRSVPAANVQWMELADDEKAGKGKA